MTGRSGNLYVGVMSGTSMDAIDVALVNITGEQLELIEYQQTPVPKTLQQAIRAITIESAVGEISKLDTMMGNLFAAAILHTIAAAKLSPPDIRAIGSHGQTVLHLPNTNHPRTLQIGDPNIIAFQSGITTVADFRRMDIAAGGQGAPLAPAFHQWLFQQGDTGRVILNIGGIANITVLSANPRNAVLGFDTGPGNGLMDAWAQQHLDQDFDEDGIWAKTGRCNQQLLSALLDEDYFSASPPKSTGKDFYNLKWLNDKLSQMDTAIAVNDVQATLLELSVTTISDAITRHAPGCGEILVCGGGVHNPVMMQGLREHLPVAVKSTEQAGINPDAVEAVAFAWLAQRRLANKPGNLPSVTGADRATTLGGVYLP